MGESRSLKKALPRMTLEELKHRLCLGLPRYRRICSLGLRPLGWREQFAGMKLQRVLGVLEQMPGEDEHCALVGLHKASATKPVEAGQSYSRSRLTADAFAAQIGFGGGDLSLRHLLAAPAAFTQTPHTSFPCRCG